MGFFCDPHWGFSDGKAEPILVCAGRADGLLKFQSLEGLIPRSLLRHESGICFLDRNFL